ncbi:MAG: antitoxin Xre/MbcA/ParS toxin-binding domain-containing protein [Cyanobacteriota bacterium ELA615]
MTQALLKYEAVQAVSKRFQVGKGTIRHILGISESTQSRYERTNPVLKSTIADRLERFERITQQALDLFEDKAETLRWLSTAKESLGGQTPLEALATDSGSKKVEELLYRAEYGIFG